MGTTTIVMLFTVGSVALHSLLSGGFSTTFVDGTVMALYSTLMYSQHRVYESKLDKLVYLIEMSDG